MFIPIIVLKIASYAIVFILGLIIGFIVSNKITKYSENDR